MEQNDSSPPFIEVENCGTGFPVNRAARESLLCMPRVLVTRVTANGV